jgi:alkylation response protein AidB-like acyl-CoA dehydrogenase
VEISFSADQRALRDSVRGFLAARAPISALRQDFVAVPGLPDYWLDMARLDLLGLGTAVELGGAGTGLVDVISVYVEMGRALSQTPHLETAIVAARLIASLGSPAQHSQLPALISGDRIVVAALQEPDEPLSPAQFQTTATRTPAGWSVHGEKILVPYAQIADELLVSARTPDGGLTILSVDPHVAGVVMTHLPNISHLPIYQVVLDGVTVPAEAVFGTVGGAAPHIGDALARAAVLRCAEIAGAGERLLDMCVEYAKTREQFGKPIGSYQAVQYLCTEIAILTRVTLLLAVQAATRIDNGDPYQTELAAARRYGKKAAAHIVSCAHELHAGVGFMEEHDLHLYTRRSKHWQFDLGNDEALADDLIARYLIGNLASAS